MRECTKEGYKVNEIKQENIIDFDSMLKCFYWKTVKIDSVREIIVEGLQCNVTVKYEFNNPFTQFNDIIKDGWSWELFDAFPLKPAYTSKLQLSIS